MEYKSIWSPILGITVFSNIWSLPNMTIAPSFPTSIAARIFNVKFVSVFHINVRIFSVMVKFWNRMFIAYIYLLINPLNTNLTDL